MKNIPKKVYIFIFALLVLLHINYYQNGFVWFDHNDIEQGFAVLTLNRVGQAFTAPFGQTSFYRPVVVILNSVDFALYHFWAPGFHITNIILYLLVIYASILFITAYWDIDKKYYPLMAIFLGVHPVTIFISASINHRQESLLALFTLLTFYFLHHAIRDNKVKNGLFALLFWTMSLFTKETAIVVIPLLTLFLEGPGMVRIFRNKHVNSTNWEILSSFLRRKWIIVILFPIVTAFYVLLRHIAIPTFWGTPYPNLTLLQGIATRIGLLGKMFMQLLLPFKPNLSDTIPILNFGTLQVIVTILAVGGALLLAMVKGFIKPLSKAAVATLLLLLPGLDLVPVPRIGSPHYSYLALPAFCALVFTFIQLQKKLLKNVFLVILTVWLTLASYSTFVSGKIFKNDEVLFINETTKDPNFVEGYYYLGNMFLQKGDFQNALDNYNKADKNLPGLLYFKDEVSINFNRATTLMQLGKLDDSYRLFEQVKKKANDNLVSYVIFNQALIQYQKGNYEDAARLLEGRTWDIADAYLLLAKCYEKLGRSDKQEEIMQKLMHQ